MTRRPNRIPPTPGRSSGASAPLVLTVIAAGTLVALPGAAQAQEPGCYLARGTLDEAAERASPLDSASIELGGDVAKVCYGSPRASGRAVMGELVPFDRPWRTGANEATGLHLQFPAEVAGIEVEPGSYSIYTVPGEGQWEVVLSSDFERWGIPISESVEQARVGSATVPATQTEEHVENMTFRFERVDERSAELILEWERTRVTIPVHRRGM